MKLKDEYERYKDLYKDGFQFNPDDEVFFTHTPETFKKPAGYEHWEVEQLDVTQYCKDRLGELGINPSDNLIELIADPGTGERVQEPVFSPNDKGDIEILQYSLRRERYSAMKMGNENTSASNRERFFFQTRLHPWHEHIADRKYDFTNGKNLPFWPKELVEKFEAKEEIETLVITEGQIKARKATFDGIPTVGFTSITHYREKQSGTIHHEVVEVIRDCKVRNLVILWDGDCLNISQKDLDEHKDIAMRPNLFYTGAANIRKMVQQFFSAKNLNIYFACIDSYNIERQPKGIDDLLMEYKNKREDIVREFEQIGLIPGKFIRWMDITTDPQVKQMRSFFSLTHVGEFYRAHQEQIGQKDFIYYGTTYRVEKDTPIIKVDANVKAYKRIGPDWFRMDRKPVFNKEGETIRYEEQLVPWKVAEIVRDHGKDVLKHVERFTGFANVASHIDYQPVIDGKWNLYNEVKHDVQPGEFPFITKLLKHLFLEQYEMSLDYLTLLYTKPYQKLPVLCLVSKKEGTGKSTFIQLLQMIYQQNMAIISSEDLTGNWSSHWVSKLIVASEETFLEKKEAMERIKALSTADTWMRSERFVTNSSIDCILKFVFCSNHEDNFIRLTKQSTRFWVRKIDKIEGKIPNIKMHLEREVPYFLHFLLNREIVHPETDRMWFSDTDIRTSAFFNVVRNSEPEIIRELRMRLTEDFLKYNETRITIGLGDIQDYWGIAKGKSHYLGSMIREYLEADTSRDAKGNEQVTSYYFHTDDPNTRDPILRKGKGKFFVFHREKFIDKDSEDRQVTMNFGAPTNTPPETPGDNTPNNKVMYYKFRAECLTDANRFLDAIECSNVSIQKDVELPDVEATFNSLLSSEELLEHAKDIEDGHVILETLQPIESYTGSRYSSN